MPRRFGGLKQLPDIDRRSAVLSEQLQSDTGPWPILTIWNEMIASRPDVKMPITRERIFSGLMRAFLIVHWRMKSPRPKARAHCSLASAAKLRTAAGAFAPGPASWLPRPKSVSICNSTSKFAQINLLICLQLLDRGWLIF